VIGPLSAAAKAMADRVHAGARRPNGRRSPFSEHYGEVAAFVAAHGGPDAAVAAAFLHDAVEDTAATVEDVARATSPLVAVMVGALTDPEHFAALPTAARKALQAERVARKGALVKLVKIADQTSNVRSVAADPPVAWDARKCMAYADGARRIVDVCRADWAAAAREFDAAYEACRGAWSG
jgi:(p)ppGpp synthase/HD superfamily hydrolase